ncbi:acyl--CoA ligase [Fusobacterium nucleatum]|uniref:class I adenylate-forming enzyme family protein n=1 Tax=Fusobacterium nucleatum TaxID=851 RepID=UPI0030D1AA52
MKSILKILFDFPEDKDMIIYEDKRYKKKDVLDLTVKIQQEILNIKYKKQTIALVQTNSLNFIASYFAILLAGYSILLLYFGSTENEINQYLNFMDIQLCLTEKKLFDESKLKGVKKIYTDDIQSKLSYINYNIVINDIRKFVFFHTSGTSDPKYLKVIPHTEEELILNAELHASSLGIKEEDIGCIVLPLSFGYANVSQLITHLLLKNTILIMKNIEYPQKIINKIIQYEVTHVTFTPFYLDLINMCNLSKKNFSQLKMICFGGSSLTSKAYKKLKTIFKNVIFVQTYGQTEAGPRITTKIISKKYNPKNVGNCLEKIEIKILKQDKLTSRPYVKGEILLNSPCMIKSYYNLDKKILYKKKWLKTGDIGYLNYKHELILLGRKTNIIKNRGFQISPEEIENYLKNKYELNFLISKEEKLILQIEGEEDIVNKEEILEDLKNQFSYYKIPDKIKFVNKLVRTSTGKIKRKKVRL